MEIKFHADKSQLRLDAGLKSDFCISYRGYGSDVFKGKPRLTMGFTFELCLVYSFPRSF